MTINGLRFLLAFILSVLLAGPVLAIPKGHVGTWVESRHFKYGAFARDIDYNTNVFHMDGLFFPDNAGVWSTMLEYTSYDAEFLLDGRQIPTNIGRLGVRVGDFAWETMDNDLRREYRQNVLVRGAAVSLQNTVDVHASAGVLAERGLFLGSGRKSSDIPVMRFGLGQVWKQKGRWDLEWEHQGSSPDIIGRQVGNAFFEHKLGKRLSVQSEARMSMAQSGEVGTSVAGGFSVKAARSGFGISARRVSPEFKGVGLYRDPHVNEVGGRVHGVARFSRHGLAGFFLDWGQDLGANESGREPEQRVHGRITLSTGIVGPWYLQSRLTYRDRSTVDPDSLYVDQNTVSGRLETGIRGSKASGYVAYGRNLFRSRLVGEEDWHETRIETQNNFVLGAWLRAQLSGYYTERTLPDGTWTSNEKRGEVRLMAEPSELRRAWILAGRERQDASIESFERDNLLVGLGFFHTLPQDFGFELEGQLAVDTHTHELDHFRWTGRITHRLHFGSNQIRVNETGEEYGSVSGFVFEDLNGNGVKEPLEPGIPGQRVNLGSGPTMNTREDGSFYFERAATVLDFMYFKATHLASRYLPPERQDFELHLNPGDSKNINIPVQLAASVQGRVIAYDEVGNVTGVPGVLLRVQGSHRDAFTNDQGEYVILGLPPGDQVMEVVHWSIPKLHENLGSAYKKVKLESGERRTITDYELQYRDPVILQKYKLND